MGLGELGLGEMGGHRTVHVYDRDVMAMNVMNGKPFFRGPEALEQFSII